MVRVSSQPGAFILTVDASCPAAPIPCQHYSRACILCYRCVHMPLLCPRITMKLTQQIESEVRLSQTLSIFQLCWPLFPAKPLKCCPVSQAAANAWAYLRCPASIGNVTTVARQILPCCHHDRHNPSSRVAITNIFNELSYQTHVDVVMLWLSRRSTATPQLPMGPRHKLKETVVL